MTIVAPVTVPSVTPRHRPGLSSGSANGARLIFPVPQPLPRRESSTVYGLGAVDDRGRISDRTALDALGWRHGTRLDPRTSAGVVELTATPSGLLQVAANGYLRLPAAVRRCCGLATGDRVLLAATPEQPRLLIYPPAVLDAIVSASLGGERA